ncbi:M20 family metallopeptidase [Candidatus Aquiluna sp. UB-MaderosW2red]|uniref:M20 metallopeptidase family protein n=1 Tax=Candidatus Aquiluna sp. UB-MaderosW2red TaxID=1855377 RepID=UPI000875EE91|nr:M20 family metallopeptidase [Candidatus Aquiluna sp. UB-MaderosW2red]SCX10703.1 hippurate hydrolase [Candidatus Aquiluna sp. UB-MaderosW2red]
MVLRKDVTNLWKHPAPEVWENMVRHRRHLHKHPEVGIDLPDTHLYVLQELEGMGFLPEFHLGAGISVVIPGTAREALPIIFRADMDALPIEEASGSNFRSVRQGAMHACGHDLHTAVLLGVAQDLIARPSARDVILVFQPGEESDRGAVKTLLHENLQIDDAEVFAIHVNAVLPSGTIALRYGTFMAAGDWFRLEIIGKGGHASAPELVGNPIRLGSLFVEGLHALAHELSTVNLRVVATTTEFLAGNAVNVIPTHGSLRGTLRTVSQSQQEELHSRMRELANKLGRDYELSASLSITKGYPPVVSDDAFMEQLIRIIIEQEFPSVQRLLAPSMVIEDFSYFLKRWPGAMVYIGAAVGDDPSFNHSAQAEFDEEAMKTGFALFRALAPGPN